MRAKNYVTASLAAGNFQATANGKYGPFVATLSGGWYSIDLPLAALAQINKLATGGGLTQVRLRFSVDDNNNVVTNYLSLYSGNAPLDSRPQLTVDYYVP